MDDPAPDTIRIPDDWDPEQAETIIDFLETLLDVLHTRYDWAIRQLWLDRRPASYPGRPQVNAREDDMPF